MATNVSTHASRQTNAYVSLFITFAAATIAVVFKLIARRITRSRLVSDDYLTLVAFFFAAAWAGLLLFSGEGIQTGLGRFLVEIPLPSDIVLIRSRLLLFHMELAYAFSLGFSKLAILAFYWRMFKASQIKIPIQVLTVATITWIIIRFGTVFAHLIIDFVLLALPGIEVYKLYLPLYQRLGTMSMFLFGMFVCVASILVLIHSFSFDNTSLEMAWDVAPIIIWASVEINLAIVAACLPMLQPIVLIALGYPPTKKNTSTNYYATPRTYPHAYPRSRSHKLGRICTHSKLRNASVDSTQRLASAGCTRNDSISSVTNFDFWGQGINTTVEVGSPGFYRGDLSIETSEGGGWGLGGIVVSRELRISISEVT
ncbi:hypothetical protein K504DRAFT_450515 [Pleomassaria siparia CBS 279.74]|uniref:Rhodopsin domain-containing protein n=1 Tax=Pleomassaria siparia CBS 279.74 TaxID=1314801 RepID=A0A6G1KM17_9PLEO|nr:hypothetical protein K504DRAFT_450515 [Pleomassaria siparia CBS 279.74]